MYCTRIHIRGNLFKKTDKACVRKEEVVKNREIRYLPDVSIFNLLSVFLLVGRILNYYPNYPTHCLYFGAIETPYTHPHAIEYMYKNT